MTEEFKTRWLAALRSGDYVQGKKRLRHAGRHCCIGVALDLHDSKQWRPGGWGACLSNEIPVREGDPLGLGSWLDPDGDVLIFVELQLAGMNDDGNSFAEIADWIEANVAPEAS